MNGAGKALALATVAVVLLLAGLFAVNWFTDQAQAERAVNAPFRVWAWRVIWISVAIIALGGALWVVGRGLHSLVNSLTIPAQHGLNPSILFLGRFLMQQEQERYAQVVAALTNGNLDRIGAGPMKAILAPRPDENLLPLPEPAELPLPPKVTIYTAPLSDQLHLPVGVDGRGPIQLPLRDLGSGLIGGLPKMGKSEEVASMIAGLLRQDASGQFLQLAVSDLKGGLDFGRIPDDLAGLAWPVAKSPEAGLALMRNVWAEVQRRQGLLDKAGVARVEVYNQQSGVARLPYLLYFVDEIMMLTMASDERGADKATKLQSAEFNNLAVRTVGLARATGVSLISATQRPSGEVIPTRLRDMCGFRIAFYCATRQSSEAVLGVGGAELLPPEPGLALLKGDQAQPRQIRTYLAGVDSGKFDQFTAGLQRANAPQLTAQTWDRQTAYRAELFAIAEREKARWPFPAPDAAPESVERAAELETQAPAAPEPTVYVSATPPTRITLPWNVNEPAGLSEAQKQHIYRVYLATARTSRDKKPHLNPAVRLLYRAADGEPMKGGSKFYLVRAVVNEMRGRAGLTALGEDE